MKPILILLLLFPTMSNADSFELLCKGEETKYLDGDPSSKEVTTKVIGIQLYEEGMRLDGEWFRGASRLSASLFHIYPIELRCQQRRKIT